jgi:hypothetical protein
MSFKFKLNTETNCLRRALLFVGDIKHDVESNNGYLTVKTYNNIYRFLDSYYIANCMTYNSNLSKLKLTNDNNALERFVNILYDIVEDSDCIVDGLVDSPVSNKTLNSLDRFFNSNYIRNFIETKFKI